MYGSGRRSTRRISGIAARVETHVGSHWDFLHRHQAQAAAASCSRRQREEFSLCLADRVSDNRMLLCAVEQLAAEPKAPGTDGLQLDLLTRQERARLAQALNHAIRSGTYRAGPVRRLRIPKSSDNGFRQLEIPSGPDKVVQRALLETLQPFVDRLFDDRSCGFRPAVGREHALCLAEQQAREGNLGVWIAEDLRDAFTQIPRGRLRDVLCHLGLDESVLALIGTVVGGWAGRGLGQGNCLSPLLLNCYGHHFLDRPLRRLDVPFVRVADDILLLASNAADAERLYSELERMALPAGLPLKGNRRDSIRRLQDGQSADWLGYRIRLGARGIELFTGPRAWDCLAENLRQAHCKPNPSCRAIEAICGWVDQLGACYTHDNRDATYVRLSRLAHQQAFEEIPAPVELEMVWRQACIRFNHLRRIIRGSSSRSSTPPSATQPSSLLPQSGSPSRELPQFTLRVEGSCEHRHIGGWAFILQGPDGERVIRADSQSRTTSNAMQLTAVVRGFEELVEPVCIQVETDSRYLYDGITQWLPVWRQNRWRGAAENLASLSLWQRLAQLMEPHLVTCLLRCDDHATAN